MRILDLGCGNRKSEGAVGLDREEIRGVDIVHDMNNFPYPLEPDSFDRIFMKHVVEHIPDTVSLMNEVHRIAKPGAEVEIHTPHYTSCNSYNDPTHVHHFSLKTFDFFCGETAHDYILKTTRYSLVKREVFFWPLHDRLGWTPYHWIGIKWLAEKHSIFYERFLAFLFPVMEFRVILKVVKDA